MFYQERSQSDKHILESNGSICDIFVTIESMISILLHILQERSVPQSMKQGYEITERPYRCGNFGHNCGAIRPFAKSNASGGDALRPILTGHKIQLRKMFCFCFHGSHDLTV